MKPTITVNQYPIGWEWLDRVPLEDFTWLIEIFSTMTDNTDTYDFATFDKEATNGEPPYPVIEINRKGLAHFMNDDQGYESGISMYGHYIACKCLDISSEREYMNQYTDIRMLTKGKFLVSFEVPGHTKEYTEGFTEEMVIPYRTEELRPYLRYPNQEINNNHLHSEFIRLRLREMLQIPLSDITIIDIISLP